MAVTSWITCRCCRWSLLTLAVLIIAAQVNVCRAEGNTAAVQKVRVRRQFYVCPPDFKRISNNCYYFSQHMATWQDAHHDCRDRHSDLAILQTPAEDKKLRGQLNKPALSPLEWWIGGIYDWEQMQWKWGASGKPLDYHGFSRMGPDDNNHKDKLKWHCIILDPSMKYKWSARSCVLGKHYICQKKVARVNRRGLEKLRKRYNSTLNEIPAPIYQKPIKPRKQQHENLANGHAKPGLKHYGPHHQHQHDNNTLDNAFGHRANRTDAVKRAGKRERKHREGKGNKQKKKQQQRRRQQQQQQNGNNLQLYIRNGTEFSAMSAENGFAAERSRKQKRNRRNKSKESREVNSAENLISGGGSSGERTLWRQEASARDEITQKTSFLANTISPLHPRIIVEEHDFLDVHTPHNRDS